MKYPESVLKSINVRVVESTFRCDELFDSKTFEVKLNDQITTNNLEDQIEIRNELSIELFNEAGTFKLMAKILGNFTLSNHQSMSEKEVNYLIRTSTTTIIFPYLRAFVTSLTALSGISPITLPLINIGQAMKDE